MASGNPHAAPPGSLTLSGADRDARIEQLLLAGLDEYFGGHYERAINLWTRVLFLDRDHDRARAYIERARNAQAELQRECEAVLHQGIEAFHKGDVVGAKRLVADALDRGASRDDAQGMLERIERLGAGRTEPQTKRRTRLPSLQEPDARARDAHARTFRSRGWMAALLLIAAGLGALVVALWGFTLPDAANWMFVETTPIDARATVPFAPEPLPLPAAAETHLARAQAFFATGRLRDALDAVERIPIGDPLRVEADRLRADIQRHWLAVAAAEQPAASVSLPAPRPPE